MVQSFAIENPAIMKMLGVVDMYREEKKVLKVGAGYNASKVVLFYPI